MTKILTIGGIYGTVNKNQRRWYNYYGCEDGTK